MNQHTITRPFAALLSFALLAMGVIGMSATPAGAAGGNVGPIDFESGYTNGSIYGQNGWAGSDACGPRDQAVVTASGYPGGATMGTKAFRISNSATCGAFADPTTPSTTNEAGETSALNGGLSGGTRQSTFDATWTIASSTGGPQPGLATSFSPDRGDGARMSYVRAESNATDLELFFDDVQGVDPPATPTPCFQCANFVETSLGHFPANVPHTIRISMQFVDGPSNDVVKVYVDGNLVHTGGSWEDYYTMDTESSPTPADQFPRTVDSLLFHNGGAAVPSVAGQGFLIDNVSVTTLPVCTTTCFVSPGGSGTQSGIDASNALPGIQAGVDTVAAGGTVNAAAGTYDEHVTIGKKLDLVGAGTGTIVDPSTNGPAINIVAGGSSPAPADRLKIRSLQTSGTTGTGNTGTGIAFTTGADIEHVTIDGVTSTGNDGNGVAINTPGASVMADIVLNNDNLSTNANDGFRIPTSLGSLDGLTITNSHLDHNGLAGWETYVATNATNQPVKNVVVTDTTFNANTLKGIYAERLSNALLQRVSVVGSGTTGASSAGIDLNLKFQAYQNINILDSTVTGDGGGDPANGAGIAVKARGTGNDSSPYSGQPATLTGVTIRNNTIGTNTPVGVRFGEPGKNNVGPTAVHVNQNTIAGNSAFGVNNTSTTTADGTCNFWGAADGPGGQGPGTGDNVSPRVTFNPFKASASDPCPAGTNIVVTPSAMHGWAFVNENTNAVETGTFVTGPPTPPKGTGSVQLTAATATDHHSILNGGYAGTPLSDISTMDYWTNQPGPTLAIALSFDIRYRTTDSAYGGRLVFEPYQNGAVTVGSGWQHWNALDGSGAAGSQQGLWWASKTTAAGSNGVCDQGHPCTWAQVLAQFPDAAINPSGGNVVLSAGSNWTNFAGEADALTIGVPASTKTFDFEAPAPTNVVVSPTNLHGWSFVNEQTDATETGTFVFGPPTPPKGLGSVQLATPTSSDHHSVLSHQFAGTKLSDITDLDYSTNQPGPTLAIALQFDIKYRTGDSAYGGRLVFEPTNQGAAVGSGWQHWNALDSTGATGGRGGKWWASKTTAAGSNGACPQAAPCTWAQVLAAFPNATMDNPASAGNGNLVLGAGSNWAGFIGQADALTIGINSANTTFDYEPAGIAPDAPTAVQADAGDSQATVSWTAPANDGGTPITGYTVTSSPGGQTCTWSTGPLTCTVTGLTNGTDYTFTVKATNLAGPGPASTASNQVTPFAWDGHLHPITPARLLDTRFSSPVGAGQTIDLGVTGVGGVPSTGVSAVVVNVTVTDPTSASFLTVFPTGEARPTTANLNFVTGQTIPNLVIMKVGAGGKISFFNANGSVDVVVDVVGWNSDATATGGSRLNPLTPARLLDTRSSSPVGAGQTIDLGVTGVGGVPSTGVSAVAVNVTATGPTTQSFMTVFPTGETRPTTANLNYVANDTIPNLVIMKVGAGGKISIFNANGSTNVVVDVVGWYADTTVVRGSRLRPLTPARLLDTRSSSPVGPGQSIDLTVTGVGGVPSTGVAAVVVNVAVTNPTTQSFMTIYPAGDPRPTTANLNYSANQTIPNLVIMKVGAGGKISIFNANGSTNVVVDVVGWYKSTPP